MYICCVLIYYFIDDLVMGEICPISDLQLDSFLAKAYSTLKSSKTNGPRLCVKRTNTGCSLSRGPLCVPAPRLWNNNDINCPCIFLLIGLASLHNRKKNIFWLTISLSLLFYFSYYLLYFFSGALPTTPCAWSPFSLNALRHSYIPWLIPIVILIRDHIYINIIRITYFTLFRYFLYDR